MDTINLNYFYGFGLAMGQVRILASSNEKLIDATWKSAISNANEWAKHFAADPIAVLPKTKKASLVFVKALEEVSKLLGQDRDLTAQESERLLDALNDFYHVFEQEVQDVHSYVVTPVGAYAVSALLENACTHLSELAQKVISKAIRTDFNKAGECLALDLYTASGFHAMRALEAEARHYHEDVTGIRLEGVPLGTLIHGDKKLPKSGLKTRHAKEGNDYSDPLGLIISLLSQINAIYRRPIMHPVMDLDAAEAKFVFDTAALAISAMFSDSYERYLKKKKRREARKAKQKATTP